MSATKPGGYWPLLLGLSLVAAGCGGGGGDNGDDAESVTVSDGPAQFVEVSSASGIEFDYGYMIYDDSLVRKFGGGVAAGDYDNDGDIDLFVVRGDIGQNILYRNNGSGIFSDATPAILKTGKRNSGPVFADMDGDGDLDLFIGAIEGDPVSVFSNQLIETGTASFIDKSASFAGLTSNYNLTAAFGDYDLDGDLDMLLTHWGTLRTFGAAVSTESLWRNDGNFTFSDQSLASGITPAIIRGYSGIFGKNCDYTFTPRFADLNNDRYPDIAVTSDYHNSSVFLNNADGSGKFTDITGFEPATFISDFNGMGSAIGDYDNDGDLDWFVTGVYGVSQPWGNRLYRNDGGTQIFTDNTFAAGITDGGWGWGACWADFNGDGHLDIFHTNGWDSDPANDFENDLARLFISQGNGHLRQRAEDSGIVDTSQGRGVVCADFDNDGDIDAFIATRGPSHAARLWRNDLSGSNYLKIRLVGLSGIAGANSEAAGARIKVKIGNITQMREISIGNNFLSQDPAIQLFGIGTASQVDEITVEWPLVATGPFAAPQPADSVCMNVPANQTLTFVQGNLPPC